MTDRTPAGEAATPPNSSQQASELSPDRLWPELFEPLDPQQRHDVAQALAASWHDGWEPNRDDVANFIDRTRGLIDHAEYLRRAAATAENRRPRSDG